MSFTDQDFPPLPSAKLPKGWKPPPGLEQCEVEKGAALWMADGDESLADTSLGSTASDVPSDGEQSDAPSEPASSRRALRADAPQFVPKVAPQPGVVDLVSARSLRPDAAEYVPMGALGRDAADFVPEGGLLRADAPDFMPAASGTAGRTKVSKDALPFVPQSERTLFHLQQAAYSMPRPPPGLRTQLSSRAAPFVRPPPGLTAAPGW